MVFNILLTFQNFSTNIARELFASQEICSHDSGIEVSKEDNALEELAAGLDNCMISEKKKSLLTAFRKTTKECSTVSFVLPLIKRKDILEIISRVNMASCSR